MPPEQKVKLKRRSSRKELDEFRFDGTHARELEMKRNRGTCAECRRLKIKCDKQIPCQSCQRRGCTALCPNGSLSTGQGTRFVLAATEHLHKRISKLSNRVRQLEDALATLQAKHSSEPHPLLHADLISASQPSNEWNEDVTMDVGDDYDEPAGDKEVIDAFGTLSISQHGVSRFFGPTGGSEVRAPSLLLPPNPDSWSPPEPSLVKHGYTVLRFTGRRSRCGRRLWPAADLFSSSFPFTPISQPPASVQALIEREHLPKWEIALGLCRTYFTEVAWLFRGLTRGQVFDDMLPALYKREKKNARFNEDGPGDREGSINDDGEQEEEWTGPHDLALLFMVFAIGALVGAPPPSFTSYTGPAQAEHFYHLSRAALSLSPILEKPSIVTVQTLHLMSVYNAMSGSDMRSETSMEMTWGCVTLGAHLGQSIGLHRDSARWGLSRKMVQRRRILFWDLFVADVWQSLNTGRPPTFSLPYVDCSFPQYEEDFGGTSKEDELWSFRFAAEVVAEVTARTLTAEAPTYATIMELDKRVRDFPLPASMTRDGKVGPGGLGGDQRGDGRDGDGGKRDGDYVSTNSRTRPVLLYIHRSFFAQAIIDHPENPLKSAYAPSFLASYRASSTILKCVIEQFKVWPGSSARFWTMWTFAFTAAVVFGTVVTRGPKSPLAKSAMRELEQACVLFSKASMYSVRATKALPILKKLNEKAHYALQAAQSSSSDPSLGTDAGLHWSVKQEDTDDELAIFAGHTRFVSAQMDTTGGEQRWGGGLYSMEHHHSQPQPHAQSQHQPQHHQQYSYAPQETRRMSGYESNGWAGPSSAGLHEPQHHHQAQPQPQHHQPQPNHRVLPRISRLPSHSSHVMYTSPASSYPNSSNESIELVPVPQAPSSTDYADYGQHQQQHQQPHTHHPPPPTHNPYQHPEHQQHHPQHHPQHLHHHHPQPPAPSTPQYQPMYSAFGPPPPLSASHTQQHAEGRMGGPGIGSGHGDHRMSGIAPTTSSDLADLGIASRDSRLDEKWSMFMSESGILEPGFRG
ncbi:fungal-specific transcription factor domain-containing protein [Ephemerocybe angulata]|uniref:Fungal-specific transcription factor domain-containing protein n=1 Tax=Ephemerocybe angulata TaxID=980116 RepID=A0A8H6M2B5_9AGAR|nr:fungal-specific transcription factor domain-containing protein [Tulosesus angulatus]